MTKDDVAQQQVGAQTEGAEDKDDTQGVQLARACQGGKAGDHQEKKRGLEEPLDLRRSPAKCLRLRHLLHSIEDGCRRRDAVGRKGVFHACRMEAERRP